MHKIKDYSVLVVEDEKPLQKAIKLKLEREGLNVVLAVDVDQALRYLDDSDVPVDAIWLDHYLLGKKDGLDLIALGKEKKLLENIPVFVVTNTGGHHKKETYLKLGAEKYYVKSDSRLDNIVEDLRKTLDNKK